MQENYHKNAKTNLLVRQAIADSKESVKVLGKKYRINKNTIAKWKHRGNEDLEDRSSRPKKISFTLNEFEHWVVCELRKDTLLSIDRIVSTLKGLFPKINRDNVYRCLKRNRLNDLELLSNQNKDRQNRIINDQIYIKIKSIPIFNSKQQQKYMYLAINWKTKDVYIDFKCHYDYETNNSFLMEIAKYFSIQIDLFLSNTNCASNGNQNNWFLEQYIEILPKVERELYKDKTDKILSCFDGVIDIWTTLAFFSKNYSATKVGSMFIYKNDDLEFLLEEINKNKIIGLEIEITGSDFFLSEIFLIKISTPAIIFVVDCKKVDVSSFKNIFEDHSIVKVLFRGKLVYKYLKKIWGIKINSIYDVVLLENLIIGYENEYEFSNNDFKNKYLQYFLDHSNSKIDKEIERPESCDVSALLPIAQKQLKEIFANNLVTIATIECKIIPIIAELELGGIKLNCNCHLDKNKLYKFINPSTNRIHSTFTQIGTKTGRVVSKEPCLQNLNKTTRKEIIANPGDKIIILDYSQIELRIIAHLSQDPNYLDGFKQGKDFHSSVASTMFNVSIEQIDKLSDLRKKAKEINFGICYGIGPKALSERIHCSVYDASKLIKLYNNTFPDARKYLDKIGEDALLKGINRTILGRIRRYCISLKESKDYCKEQESIKRQGMNFTIQACCSDILKLSLAFLHYDLKEYDARIINVVHDEILIEAKASVAEEVCKIAKRAMVKAGELVLDSVPVDVNAKISDCWEKP